MNSGQFKHTMPKAQVIKLIFCTAIFIVFLVVGFDTEIRHIHIFAWEVFLYACLALVLVIIVIAFLIDLFRKRKYFIYPTIILLPFVLGMFIANISKNYFLQKRTENAHKLINALESYHTASHSYPSTLDELVPNYIEKIPVIRFGLRTEDFVYRSDRTYWFISWDDLDGIHRCSSSDTEIEVMPWTSGMY